jgi:glutathione synthase
MALRFPAERCALRANSQSGAGETMARKALIVADPLEGLNYAGDTSLALTEAGLEKGWEVFFTTPNLLWRGMDGVMADARQITAVNGASAPHAQKRTTQPTAGFDVIAMRKDPPVDVHFITCIHLLEDAARHSLVTAHPRGLLSFSEKLMTPELLHYGPPTLVSQDPDRLLAFLAEHGDVVLKPLYRGGGSGIVRLSGDNLSARSIISLFLKDLREPVQMQAFLPSVFDGDARVIMVGDEVVGAFKRIPDKADFRSNMAQGGGVIHHVLSDGEREICAHVARVMADQGVVLSGLDFIGGKLTEVNITSPTGIRVLQRMAANGEGPDIAPCGGAGLYWQALEASLATQ